MEEKIQNKIDSILDCIINKPTESITADDYMILSAELKDIRFRKSQEDSREQLLKLMASSPIGFGK